MTQEFRRTRIIATLGPASSDPEKLSELIDAGVDIFRLNFSHGSYEQHGTNAENIRRVASQKGRHIAILQDLCGPKLRIGKFEEDSINLEVGADFTLVCEDIGLGDVSRVSISYEKLASDLSIGDELLLDDGRLKLVVKALVDTEIRCTVVIGGALSNNKGLNVPGCDLSTSSLTDKDVADLNFGAKLGVDWVAISFVRNRDDIILARHYLNRANSNSRLMAKIEKPTAVDKFEDILELCDGIMVARGDLGVELPAEQVPLIQKRLIDTCRLAGKPVITATQMLESMIQNPNPTRAEASDVANAIYDGTDGVMLSAETAVGDYPVEAVSFMARIAGAAEADSHFWDHVRYDQEVGGNDIADGVSYSACRMAERMQAKVIVVFSQSGSTALRVARNRFDTPILAISPSDATCRALKLAWGTLPYQGNLIENTEDMVSAANQAILDTGLAKRGDRYVITCGVPFGIQGSTNMIRVEHVI